jgi:hypothetical protein
MGRVPLRIVILDFNSAPMLLERRRQIKAWLARTNHIGDGSKV